MSGPKNSAATGKLAMIAIGVVIGGLLGSIFGLCTVSDSELSTTGTGVDRNDLNARASFFPLSSYGVDYANYPSCLAAVKHTMQKGKTLKPLEAHVVANAHTAGVCPDLTSQLAFNTLSPSEASKRWDLQSYQKGHLDNFVALLHDYYGPRPNVDILDNGCDPSGNMPSFVAEHTTGTVYCLNVGDSLEAKIKTQNIKFVATDGKKLPFDNHSMDIVWSINVMEHASTPELYLEESHRVLKHGGIAVFRWNPLYSGDKGHHLHVGIVQSWAKELGVETRFNPDTSLAKWDHLILTPEEFIQKLVDQGEAESLAKKIQAFAQGVENTPHELNKLLQRDAFTLLSSYDWCFDSMSWTNIAPHGEVLEKLRAKYGAGHRFNVSNVRFVAVRGCHNDYA